MADVLNAILAEHAGKSLDIATAYFSVGDIFFSIKDYFSAAAMYKKGLRYEPGDEMSRQRKKEAEIRSQKYMLIYFDFDSASIPPHYLSRLDVVGRILAADKPKLRLMASVIGHACHLGPSAYNRRLSLRRAKAVASHLHTKFSLNPKQIIVAAQGEDAPILSGKNKATLPLNRRVEVIVGSRKNN